MEKAPSLEQPKTEQEIRARLAEIDKLLFALSEALNRSPAEFEEDRSGDGSAVEQSLLEPKLGEIRREREALEVERTELHAQLDQFRKAA